MSIDFDAFSKFEVVPASLSDEPPLPQRALRLFSVGGDCIDFGVVHRESGAVFARRGGRLYVGCNASNPGSFAANGDCVERHTMGVTMETLLWIFTGPTLPGTFEATPREDWCAGFELLSPARADTAPDVLRLRVYFTTPFAGTQTATFRDEITLHWLPA